VAIFSRRSAPVYGIVSGVAVGAIVTFLVLATTPAQSGYSWPPASRVENASSNFEPRTTAGIGIEILAPDCTTMLVDMDSTMPASVWVVPHGAPINYNETTPSPGNYHWSGNTPVEHLSVVVSITNPAAGFTIGVFDASYTENGTAYFGFAFSASDCP
jgi:hypothetical protein